MLKKERQQDFIRRGQRRNFVVNSQTKENNAHVQVFKVMKFFYLKFSVRLCPSRFSDPMTAPYKGRCS